MSQNHLIPMKKITLVSLWLVCFISLKAQFPVISPAVETALTLTFPISVSNSGNVAWNPSANLYYSCRIGNAVYPLITWNALGVQMDYDTTGQDSRGMWWNASLNQLERNCFSSVGWAKINLDANSYAENTFSILFSGMLQPNAQSVGTYDPDANQVIFYNAGNCYKYDRTTGLLVSTLALTGATLTTITANGIVYTGVTGAEIGIYDYSAKKVLLFNKTTGVFSASSTLPATAPGPTTYGIGYANNLFWVYKTSPESKWYSYRIFDIPLPVYAIALAGNQIANANYLHWTVDADEPVVSFDLQHSSDGKTFKSIASIPGSSDGSEVYEYMHQFPAPGANYYQVISTDQQGEKHTSDIVCITSESLSSVLKVFPNPADEVISIGGLAGGMSYTIYDESGRQIASGNSNPDGTISLTDLPSGNYFLYLASTPIRFIKQ